MGMQQHHGGLNKKGRRVVSLLLCLLFIIIQADLVVSQCNVSNCQTGFCDGNNCTQCRSGYYKLGDTCPRCYLSCRDCHNIETHCYASVSNFCGVDFFAHDNCSVAGCPDLKCSKCPDGFYSSNNRCFRCHNSNCKCSSALGCDECLKGFFGESNFCYNKCPSNCLSCVGAMFCTECRPGKFGRTCDLDCLTTCSDGTCDIYTGTCLICPSNHYLTLETGLCSPCPDTCKDQNCSRTDGTCIAGCSLGHTGRRCEEDFKADCLECDQFDSSLCHHCRCAEGFQTTSQTNTGESHLVSNNDKANNGTVIALSAVVGILLIVAVVAITVNIILFRRLKQKTTHPNNAVNNAIISGEVIETNDYQDLNRDRGANTYSSITRDYENTL